MGRRRCRRARRGSHDRRSHGFLAPLFFLLDPGWHTGWRAVSRGHPRRSGRNIAPFLFLLEARGQPASRPGARTYPHGGPALSTFPRLPWRTGDHLGPALAAGSSPWLFALLRGAYPSTGPFYRLFASFRRTYPSTGPLARTHAIWGATGRRLSGWDVRGTAPLPRRSLTRWRLALLAGRELTPLPRRELARGCLAPLARGELARRNRSSLKLSWRRRCPDNGK